MSFIVKKDATKRVFYELFIESVSVRSRLGRLSFCRRVRIIGRRARIYRN